MVLHLRLNSHAQQVLTQVQELELDSNQIVSLVLLVIIEPKDQQRLLLLLKDTTFLIWVLQIPKQLCHVHQVILVLELGTTTIKGLLALKAITVHLDQLRQQLTNVQLELTLTEKIYFQLTNVLFVPQGTTA